MTSRVMPAKQNDPSSRFGKARDELLDLAHGLMVVELNRRRLHEIARRAGERAADSAVEGKLAATNRIHHDAGRIRGIPDFEFQFTAQRHVAKTGSFEPDVADLAVRQPRYMIARTDMNVLGRNLVI